MTVTWPRLICCFSATLVSLAASFVAGGEPIPESKAETSGKWSWYSIELLDVEGRGFTDTQSPFDRLPGAAKEKVRSPVWNLSRHSAGICVRFETDATEIEAQWQLTSGRLAMPHMPATGVSGLDLYVKHQDQWRWLGVGFPREKADSQESQSQRATLTRGIPKEARREFLLYLPLYNGVTEVKLGLPTGAALWKADARNGNPKPVVFYGTSITQGGCASRPGMVHTAILGRWLDVPVINLGFSGNGRLEPEVGEFLVKIDASVFVLDCLPNLNPQQVAERAEPFVKLIRQRHPNTPIVLVEDRNYSNSFLVESQRKRNDGNQAALRAAFEKLKGNDRNLYYLEGKHLLGEDNEGTVDSSHPTDLGFLRQAEAFQKVLAPILRKQRENQP